MIPVGFIISVFLLNKCTANVAPTDVTYYLYTRQQEGTYTQLMSNNVGIVPRDAVNVFIIHGWTEDRSVQWYEDLKNAYLRRNDIIFNVIQVDWSKPANELYPVSYANTFTVGNIIAEFIIDLMNSGVSLANIHVTGHSLGGQVAGFAGKRISSRTGQKLPRINALDPAGPLYDFAPPQIRLAKTDAIVVVVIHTDAGAFGYIAPCGTIDFWVNGGNAPQNGCPLGSDILLCSHHQSWRYYIQAMLTNNFYGTLCRNYRAFQAGECDGNTRVNFGGLITAQQIGNYYATTSKDQPFRVIN